MVVFLKNKKDPEDPYELHFRSLNYETKFVPLLEHEYVNGEELSRYLTSAEFSAVDALIITSQRAIGAIVTHLEALDDEVKLTLQSKPVYTVGPATAKELAIYGFTDIRGAEDAGNGKVLADIILSESLQTFVFFTGEIRRDTIPTKLRGANRELAEKIVYKTLDKSDTSTDCLDAIRANPDSWIVFFSPSGTEQILQLLKDSHHQEGTGMEGTKLACIGPTTYDFLVSKGFEPSAVAERPDPISLVEAITIKQHHKTQLK